jgi:hypothetical protein
MPPLFRDGASPKRRKSLTVTKEGEPDSPSVIHGINTSPGNLHGDRPVPNVRILREESHMKRALGAAIITIAAFGTTAALAAPAFASDNPHQPQLITSDQLTPILECSEPAGVLRIDKGEKVKVKDLRIDNGRPGDDVVIKSEHREFVTRKLGPEDEACGEAGEMKCVVRKKDGGRMLVSFRDEKGTLHKRYFESKKTAQVFTKKDKHVIKWVGCAVLR